MTETRIEIHCNGEKLSLPPGITAALLLAEINPEGKRCLLVINQQLVHEPQFALTPIHHGDIVDLYEPVVGG